jgi:hypothetical protein
MAAKRNQKDPAARLRQMSVVMLKSSPSASDRVRHNGGNGIHQ